MLFYDIVVDRQSRINCPTTLFATALSRVLRRAARDPGWDFRTREKQRCAFCDDNASSVRRLVCFPYVTYLHFKTEKETSVFSSSLVTCTAELCMQHMLHTYTRDVWNTVFGRSVY